MDRDHYVSEAERQLSDSTFYKPYTRICQASVRRGQRDALLVSMDVTPLNTNIPHSDGIKACEEAREERDIKDPPTQTLVKLLKLVLKCNSFEFNGQHYLQVQGTAMVTK